MVSCSSRDELDAVCSAVSNLPFISLSPLVLLSDSFFHALLCMQFLNFIKKSQQSDVCNGVNDFRIVIRDLGFFKTLLFRVLLVAGNPGEASNDSTSKYGLVFLMNKYALILVVDNDTAIGFIFD